MNPKKLPKPIPLTLEQYECQTCKKKFYINKEDQLGNDLTCPDNAEQSEALDCPFCNSTALNIREFDVEILALGEV